MASLHDNDPALARFRRGAGTRVGPPGPPPLPSGSPAGLPPGLPPAPLVPTDAVAAEEPSRPITTGTIPGWATDADPAGSHPLFGDLVAPPPAVGFDTPDDAPTDDWPPVEVDPGRTSGVVSIVVGVFVGIVGLFIGVYSIKRSREAGLVGVLGLVGVVVSVLSLVLVGVVGLSWVRYEVDLAQQCAVVGPGTFLTQSGAEVTCH